MWINATVRSFHHLTQKPQYTSNFHTCKNGLWVCASSDVCSRQLIWFCPWWCLSRSPKWHLLAVISFWMSVRSLNRLPEQPLVSSFGSSQFWCAKTMALDHLGGSSGAAGGRQLEERTKPWGGNRVFLQVLRLNYKFHLGVFLVYFIFLLNTWLCTVLQEK